MRSLVWRYVSTKHRKDDESAVTEDDINEVKCDISAMRYEMLEIFERNGMDISSADKKEKGFHSFQIKSQLSTPIHISIEHSIVSFQLIWVKR